MNGKKVGKKTEMGNITDDYERYFCKNVYSIITSEDMALGYL